MIIVDEGRNFRLVGALRHRQTLFGMPGAHKWKDEQFFCESTRANIEFLETYFPAAEWRPDTKLKEVQALRKREEAQLIIDTSCVDYPFKRKPFGHQLDAFALSKDLQAYAYLMEMGTGKTKVLIDNMGYLWLNGRIQGAVIVAPNGVHRQFVNEQLPEHMIDSVMKDVDAFVYQSGGDKAFQRRKADFLKAKPGKLRILAINVEALSHKSGMDYVIKFLTTLGAVGTRRPVLMAVDESTRIKNHMSGRSKNVRALGKACQYRRILTGSPITRGVEDLFGQFLFLGEETIGFRSFYTFRNRYCILKSNGDYQSVIGYQNLEELKKKIKPWSHRVRKEDCLDLPPKVYVRREVELSDQQREMYRQLRRELLLEFEGMTLTAAMAAVRITKLQQILCGHIRFTNEQKLIVLPDIPRIQVTKDLIEESGDQVIVWARFTPDIDRLCQELAGYGVSRYDGSVNNNDRELAIKRFRSGTNQIFVGQPASAGLGLNLVGPATVIYYSNSFDAEHRWQSEDRNHRAGTTRSVTYYDLVVPHSIDNYILANLAKKKDIASTTIDEMKVMLQEEP